MAEVVPLGRPDTDVLAEDHREVEEWFDEYDELKESDQDRKAELAEKICLALKVHARIE